MSFLNIGLPISVVVGVSDKYERVHLATDTRLQCGCYSCVGVTMSIDAKG